MFNFDKRVSYDHEAKAKFLRAGKRQLKKVAEFLSLTPDQYELRVNEGGIAVSGEVTLHTDNAYVQIFQPSYQPGGAILYRTVQGRHDYIGGVNHFAPAETLNFPDIVARYVRNILPKVE